MPHFTFIASFSNTISTIGGEEEKQAKQEEKQAKQEKKQEEQEEKQQKQGGET